MCLLRKSKSHLTSKLNQDLKNPCVLTSESFVMRQKVYILYDHAMFTCVGSEEAPVGDSHRDHAQHEADDAHEDHGPAVGRLGLPGPGPVPGPRGAWPPIPASHRTQCILSWTFFLSHAFPGKVFLGLTLYYISLSLTGKVIFPCFWPLTAELLFYSHPAVLPPRAAPNSHIY